MRWTIAVLLALSASACGQPTDLAVKPGMTAPPKPYGRSVEPGSTELLQTPTQAMPERSTELRTHSEERADDPFDLPPPE